MVGFGWRDAWRVYEFGRDARQVSQMRGVPCGGPWAWCRRGCWRLSTRLGGDLFRAVSRGMVGGFRRCKVLEGLVIGGLKGFGDGGCRDVRAR